jgi:hypothetical protein
MGIAGEYERRPVYQRPPSHPAVIAIIRKKIKILIGQVAVDSANPKSRKKQTLS